MLWRVGWWDGEAYVQCASRGGAKVFVAGRFKTHGALLAEPVTAPPEGAEVYVAEFTKKGD